MKLSTGRDRTGRDHGSILTTVLPSLPVPSRCYRQYHPVNHEKPRKYPNIPYYIIHQGSELDVDVKWIISLIQLKYTFSTPAAPERQRTPEDSAGVPRPTHKAAFAIPGERVGVAHEFGERLFFRVGLPETANNHYIFFWLSGRALDSGRQK